MFENFKYFRIVMCYYRCYFMGLSQKFRWSDWRTGMDCEYLGSVKIHLEVLTTHLSTT